MGDCFHRQHDVRKAGQDLCLNAAHRPRYLFSGVLGCGECEGAYTIIDNKRYGCANHRNRGTCVNTVRVSRRLIERRILDGVKDWLLTPQLFRVFATEYIALVNRRAHDAEETERTARHELAAVNAKIEAVLEAIEDGIRTPSTKRRLELEARREQLEANFQKPEATQLKLRLHPRLTEGYRRKVGAFEEALNDPEERGQAAEIMRSLIDKVVLTPEPSGRRVGAKLYGELAGILALAENEGRTGRFGPVRLSLVAEERSSRYHSVTPRRFFV